MLLGTFSYIGAFISDIYHFNFMQIGLIMTVFGAMSVIGGRLSGKIANRIGKKRILIIGLMLATLSNFVLLLIGNILSMLIVGVGLLGLGFIFAHSTLITIATEFSPKSRATAMSLVAACFVTGGGIGTAIGGGLIKIYGFNDFFLYYGIAFILLVIAAAILIGNQDKSAKVDRVII
jgi:predicted MFS family arabinose efflux permease